MIGNGNGNGAGLGIVVRDWRSSIVCWRHKNIPFITCPEIDEALAARCAMELAKERQYSHVIF